MRGVNLEDSWKGEILPGFLFLGDRCAKRLCIPCQPALGNVTPWRGAALSVTASDMDRLTTLEVTHIVNATEDVANFFEGSSAAQSKSSAKVK